MLTIGHSTRPIDTFVEILQKYEITHLVDIRTIPYSRYNPQYGKEQLALSLEKNQIKYSHNPGLGGLRHTTKESQNVGWKNASFRGFADYMQTLEFASSLSELIKLCNKEIVVIMCAEAVPWRCHRSLISDAVLIRGFKVIHIVSLTNSKIHSLTPWARVDGTNITYPEINLK